ncbi:MAG: fucose isomerase [Paludibacteraceae bacterium]
MTHLNLITFASELNKQGTIRHAHRQLFDILDAHYEVHIVSPDAVEALERNELQLVFISSGGVEYMFRNYYEQLPKPIVLLTDGLQNSLAASLEISTWARRQGTACRIIHGDEPTLLAELTAYEHLFAKRHLLAGKRIGVIGEPSKWLIASSVNPIVARQRWGIEFVDIALDEVEDNFNATTDDEVRRATEQFIANAQAVREPQVTDVLKAYRLYNAIKTVCLRHNLDAFTIQCFGLIPRIGTTGCLALSLLNDEGIVAGCEGDMQTVFTMLAVKTVVGCDGFMCNPSQIDAKANSLLLAHCTIGLKQTQAYIVRNHFESLSGVAVQGTLPDGDYTLVKCGGSALDEYFVSSAHLLQNTDFDDVCRTQVRLKLHESCNYFFQNPLGNHHVLLKGNHAQTLENFFELNQAQRVH